MIFYSSRHFYIKLTVIFAFFLSYEECEVAAYATKDASGSIVFTDFKESYNLALNSNSLHDSGLEKAKVQFIACVYGLIFTNKKRYSSHGNVIYDYVYGLSAVEGFLYSIFAWEQ